jgi:hypothetical protein
MAGLEPIVGYRYWRIIEDPLSSRTVALRSMFMDVCWGVGPGVYTEARCLAASRPLCFSPPEQEWRHRPPDERCDCGLYAWTSVDRASAYPQCFTTNYSQEPPRVLGAIVGAGTILIHDKDGGFRAQRARPVALAHPREPAWEPMVAWLTRTMAIPCVPEERLEWVAREFGQLLPPP